MAKQGRGGLARFGEPGVLVLLSLSDGPKHGHGITADVLDETGVGLGPGTLYGALTRLWIEAWSALCRPRTVAVPTGSPTPAGRRC
jgi:hypothetical protein